MARFLKILFSLVSKSCLRNENVFIPSTLSNFHDVKRCSLLVNELVKHLSSINALQIPSQRLVRKILKSSMELPVLWGRCCCIMNNRNKRVSKLVSTNLKTQFRFMSVLKLVTLRVFSFLPLMLFSFLTSYIFGSFFASVIVRLY